MSVQAATQLFQQGIAAYREGQHYEAHEFWEELWQEENDEDRHRFLQALIQVASAVHKAKNNVGPRGSVTLLGRAQEKLEGLPDGYMGLDVARLREEIARCRDELQQQLSGADQCSLLDAFIPAIVQCGERPLWPPAVAAAPLVPPEARSAWFERGLAAYADGAYFEAHEFWEELWREAPEGPDRQFLQGLIQVAAAMHKNFAHGKPAPAARLLERALLRLRAVPESARGLQVGRLVREAERAREALLAVVAGDGEAESFDKSLVPHIVGIVSTPPSV